MRASIEVADIFRIAGPAWRTCRAGHLSLAELKVMSAIEHCRTAALGGHIEGCDECGHLRVAYNSCRNRHCPRCQGAAARDWLAEREADLLPVGYFHVVFTLPVEIATIAFQNKAAVYNLLFKAAAETMTKIAADCPLPEGVRQNLRALKTLRDKVEHHLLGRADQKWLGLFQACCLNFDKALCDLFGKELTLASELSFALQFASMNLEQVTTLNQYELPPDINAIDALITDGMTPEQLNNIEFQFQVVYTLSAAAKSKAHIQFVNPVWAEGKEIHNVLAKKVISDDLYPLKPGKVVKNVAAKTKQHFTSHTHQQAMRYFNVRPKNGAPQPENTDKMHCIYHPVYKAYAYSPEWVEKLVAAVTDAEVYAKIRAVKL